MLVSFDGSVADWHKPGLVQSEIKFRYEPAFFSSNVTPLLQRRETKT
jgi:hypothetical protein